MGDFTTVGLEEVIERFSRQEAAAERAVPLMLQAGAEVLVQAQQQEASQMGIQETAGFIQAIKATEVKGDQTEKYVEVYPQGKAKHGNDRKKTKDKVRYATIGFINEYGTSSQPARPYMSSANEKAAEKVTAAEFEVWKGESGG